MKRALIFLILFSMMLHCSVRLGLFTYAYQNRTVLAYTLGLISERPIAMCSTDADHDLNVHFEVADESEKTLPVSIQTYEIKLFCVTIELNTRPQYAFLHEKELTGVLNKEYPPPILPIFHPPS